MKIFDRGLEFTIHEDTNRIMVRVVDRSDHNNEEVIRKFHPKKILDMIAAFMDMIGLLVDQRAGGAAEMNSYALQAYKNVKVSTASEGDLILMLFDGAIRLQTKQ